MFWKSGASGTGGKSNRHEFYMFLVLKNRAPRSLLAAVTGLNKTEIPPEKNPPELVSQNRRVGPAWRVHLRSEVFSRIHSGLLPFTSGETLSPSTPVYLPW